MPVDHLILLASSPRLPAGLLSWHGWEALRSGPVYAADLEWPQVAAVRSAGIDVHPLPGDPADVRSMAFAFRDLARGGRTAVWLAGPDGDPRFAQALGDLVAREAGGAELEVVYASWDPPGARLLDVVATVARLRGPDGCPWINEQSHESLTPYLLEEAYETVQAVEDADPDAVREELGDVLFQIVLHARIAELAEDPGEQSGTWTVDDVAGYLVDKLIRRHPHVFAGVEVADSAEAHANWEALKRQERAGRPTTDGVPLSQPALALAAALLRRADRAGVPPDLLPGEEAGTGPALFTLTRRASTAGEDPETALRTVARHLRDDITEAERRARADGHDPHDLTPDQWRKYWPR